MPPALQFVRQPVEQVVVQRDARRGDVELLQVVLEPPQRVVRRPLGRGERGGVRSRLQRHPHLRLSDLRGRVLDFDPPVDAAHRGRDFFDRPRQFRVLEPRVFHLEPHVVLPLRHPVRGVVEVGFHVRVRGQPGQVRDQFRGEPFRRRHGGRAEREVAQFDRQGQVVVDPVQPPADGQRAVALRVRGRLNGQRGQRVVEQREVDVGERGRGQRAAGPVGDYDGGVLEHERRDRLVRRTGFEHLPQVPLAVRRALDAERRAVHFHLADEQYTAVQSLFVVVQNGVRDEEERLAGGVALAGQPEVGDGDPAQNAHPGRTDVDVHALELFAQGVDDLLPDPVRADPRIGDPRAGGESRHAGEDQPADQPTANAHPCPSRSHS
nr:hypothetical protein [Frigoriglobus tundricola]